MTLILVSTPRDAPGWVWGPSAGIWCSPKRSPNQSFHCHQSLLDTIQIRILSPWGILVHNPLAPICTILPSWSISLTKFFLIFSQHLNFLVPPSYLCESRSTMAPGTFHICFLVLCLLVINHKHLVELGWGHIHFLTLAARRQQLIDSWGSIKVSTELKVMGKGELGRKTGMMDK